MEGVRFRAEGCFVGGWASVLGTFIILGGSGSISVRTTDHWVCGGVRWLGAYLIKASRPSLQRGHICHEVAI